MAASQRKTMPTSHVHTDTQTMKIKKTWMKEYISYHWLCNEACSTTPKVFLGPKVKPSAAKRRDVYETLSKSRQKNTNSFFKRTTGECWLWFLVNSKHLISFCCYVWGGKDIYTADPRNVELSMVFLELFLCWIAVGFALCSSHVVLLLLRSGCN